MSTVTTSVQFWLNARDFVKAFLISALSTPVSIVLASFAAGHFCVNWTEMWHIAAASGAAYLVKNLFTPSQTITPTNPVGK